MNFLNKEYETKRVEKIYFHSIRKNPNSRILRNEPNKQYLNIVLKFCPYKNMVV